MSPLFIRKGGGHMVSLQDLINLWLANRQHNWRDSNAN